VPLTLTNQQTGQVLQEHSRRDWLRKFRTTVRDVALWAWKENTMLVGLSVTTDQNGQFRIEHPGAVIQFRKEKLKLKAVFTAITHHCIGRA
jgi:hypothetical protein